MSLVIVWIGVSLWILCILVLLIHHLYFILKAVRSQNNDSHDVIAHRLPISLIICAKNEERHLLEYAKIWCEQDYKDEQGNFLYEVVLVDDNSEDGSHYLFAPLMEQYPHLRIVQLRQAALGIPGKKFPLSMGIKEAQYDHLLMTDADCVPNSNQWLAKMARSYTDGYQIVLGYGGLEKEAGFLNQWQRWETLSTALQYFGFSLRQLTYMGVGRNLGYHRKLFYDQKGFTKFHHVASGDDDLFVQYVAQAKNTACILDPDTFVYSKGKSTWSGWWLQKNRHVSTAKFYKPKYKFLLGLIAAAHFYFWIGWILILFIPASIFVKVALGGVGLLRILVHWIVFTVGARKMKEQDLIKWIPIMDIMTLFYNLKMIPATLFNKKSKWK
jgi:glycosyltransferase involved in cell wall biosynthesis